MASPRKNSRKHHSRGMIILSIFLELMIVLVFVFVLGWDKGIGDWCKSFSTPVVRELSVTGLNSPNFVLMQAKGGRIICGEGAEERIYPASMTKMMTAVLALERVKSLDQYITLTDTMFEGLAEQDATQAGFQPGETVSIRDLLYGALLPSGAECCLALAETISGSEEAFSHLMNQKARRIGMLHTNFLNSTGLPDENHYSTVYDMAVLLKYCLRNSTFREIVEMPYYSTMGSNIHPDGITFYSSLFQKLPDPYVTGGRIMGGKTGYTDAAGLCLASYANIEGRDYILVTAGAPGYTGEPLHIQDAVTVYEQLGQKAQLLKGQSYSP